MGQCGGRRVLALPPGLQREALPTTLQRRLGPVPDGYVRIRVCTDIVLIDQHTRVIPDVVYDITGD